MAAVLVGDVALRSRNASAPELTNDENRFRVLRRVRMRRGRDTAAEGSSPNEVSLVWMEKGVGGSASIGASGNLSSIGYGAAPAALTVTPHSPVVRLHTTEGHRRSLGFPFAGRWRRRRRR